MYNSILILDDSLTQAKKDVIYALKKTNVLVLEFSYASKTYEDLKNELNEIYQEREILGNDLELQNVVFMNTKFEHTNVFQSYLNQKKSVLSNIEVNDPNYNSWSKLTDLIDYCKSSFSLEHFDILDINHLYYSESWSHVFQHIHNNCDLSNSFMKVNYLSKSIIMDETNTSTLHNSDNWLKTLLNDFSDLNEDIMNLMNLYFMRNNEDSNNLLNSSTLFNIESNATVCNNYSLNSYISNRIRVLIIPCLQQSNNESFALLVKQLNITSQNEILPVFLNDDENLESFSQKFVTLYSSFTRTIDTSGEYELYMGIYLPPYWNDQPNPSNVISLSSQLQTISLELNNNQPSSGSIFSSIVQLIKSQYTYVSKLYFEFFNLTQNYSNNLNLIYKNLSTQEEFAGFVGFYFSYVTHLDKYHNIFKPEQDHIEIYNKYVNNMIYYDNGVESYYYEEQKHSIEYFLNLEKNKSFKTRDFIENVKVHNIILYNEELAHYLDEIQESLTPNTLLLKFSPYEVTYESMKQQLLSLNEESNVDIKNVALFQHSQEGSEHFVFLQDQDHTFYDVSNSDPELTTWSKFTEFTLFLQNELHVSNFDLLMCQIYSDPNWVYILNKIESQLTSLNIRSSDDNTGHIMFDGDWVLESENVDVNMIYLYFNEKVLDININLATFQAFSSVFVSSDQQSLYIAGYGPNPSNYGLDNSRKYFNRTKFYGNTKSDYNVLDSDEKILEVAVAREAFLFRTSKNKLYSFGKNTWGILGYGSTASGSTVKNFPQEVQFSGTSPLNTKKMKQLSLTTGPGQRSTMAFILFEDGTIYGSGSSGTALGTNIPTSQYFGEITYNVTYNSGEKPIRIATGYYSIIVLTNQNRLFTAADNNSTGMTARGTTVGDSTYGLALFQTGHAMASDEKIITLIGDNTTFAFLTDAGNLYGVGHNGGSQLGTENTHLQTKIVKIPNNLLSGGTISGKIIKVFPSQSGFIIYTDSNKYYAIGEGNSYRTLLNTELDKKKWVELHFNPYSYMNNSHMAGLNNNVNAFSAMNENGEVFSWGYSGVFGILGTNQSNQIKQKSPHRTYISSTSNSSNYFTDASFGLNHFDSLTNEEIDAHNGPSSSGSSSYNIPVISSFNTDTDASSNTVLHFDSDSSYSDVSYALTTGIYKITNVPSNTPLALINNGQTDHIVYGGTTTESNSYGPNNSNYYNFVSGTMYIEVDSSFDPIGFYTTANSGSYLGTQGDLTYSAAAIEYSNISVDSASASTNILASSSYFNIFKDTSSNYFGILSDNNEISGNVYDNYKFITYSTYQITNIPEQYKLAIVELSSNDVTITGDNNKKSSHNIDGVAHDFYYGDISINASYGFDTLKLYVYNGLKSSVVELQNNITFELPNVSLVQNEASRKVLSKDVFLKVYKNSTTEYLVHFNENDELSGNFYDNYSIEDVGIYKFKSIPTRYLFGIKVNSNASSIEISGNDSNKSTYSAGGGNVDFYHGDLYVKINDLSYNISTYIYDTSTSTSVRVGSDSNEFIDFANFGISGPTPVFMTLNVSEKFDTYGVFNIVNIDPSFSSQPYDDSREFGVYKNQTYVINAPTAFPLALVGRLDQSDISYGGYSENQDGTTNIGGTDYPLYHGPVFFTINGDLSANNTLSFYTKNQYNLNTTGSIVYDASSEFSLDLSTNHYVENEDTYNIEMMIKSIVSETTPTVTTNHLVSRFVSPNKINKNTTFYKNEKLVVYKNSVYNINQIPSWYPITILNNGITNKITLSGDANKKITQDVSGTSYDFYYGDISFSVLDSISDLSGVTLYSSYGGGTLVNNEHMIIMKEDSSLNEPLQQLMSMKIYTNGNGDPVYQLNDKSAIMSNYKFGAYVGTYVIKDVPEAYSMAVINNDISDVVTYSGTYTKGNYAGPDSIEYPFYYGTVTMTIKSYNEDIDGSYISLYSYNNGYMGAQNIIEISSNQVYNIMDQDLYLAVVSSVDTSITLTESETALLQTEFIATTENETVSTWSANYVKENSNGSTSLTNSNTMFQYNSDDNGPYFLVNSNTSAVILQNYPNQSYLFNMDSTSGAVLCYEMWCYYSGNDGTMTNGWVMGVETGWGPYLALNTGGGIGATPIATDGNSYSSLTNPGYITDNANKGQLLHIVTYWEQLSSSNHARGVYINGTHYPQETTSQSGRSNFPGFDSINSGRYFQIGGSNSSSTGGSHAVGLRIYSFRIWHGDIRSKVSTLYDGGPHANINTGSSSSSSSSSLTYFTPLSYQKDSSNVTIENPTTYQNIDVSMAKYTYFTEKLPTSTSSSTYTDASGCKTIMLNGETTYDANKVYSVYDGTYTISATSANAFAIINTDSSGSHPLVITGGTIETTKNSLYNTEISYNYYSGDVTFKVLGYFDNVVLIEHIDSSSNSQSTRIKYDETANPSVYTESSGSGGSITTECLDISSSLSVADGKYLLNGNTSYDENRNFGVYIGSYEIHDVPTSHPLAILNNDVSNNVTYSGTTLEGNQEVDGVTYNYYSGKLTLTIQNDFTSDLSALSLHCLNHGYMGGQNKIVFTSDCSGSVPAEEEEGGESVNKTCLRTNTKISIPASISSTNGIILNYGYVNTYDSTLLYGLDIGSYIITDIPPQTPLAIFNHDVSSSVEYTGETLQLSMFNPNQSREYNYYSGYVRMVVKSIPSDVSYVSFGIFKNKEFHDETNKFIFDSACSTDDYYYDCIDTHSLIELSGNVIHVNETSYETGSKKLAVYNGYVEFRHVPEDNPIAFISASNSDDISYQGLAYNKQTLTINSQNVDFYHGNVVLRILNNFENDLVLHMKQTDSTTTSTLNLYYSDYCDYKSSDNSLLPYVECLAFDNCMNFTNLLSRRHLGFNLDTDDVISTQRMYGFNVGLYKFNNISEDDAIRITNISNGDVFLSSDEIIEIQGVNDTSDNVYYYGDVFLHVTTDVSYLSLGNSNGIEFTTAQNANFIGKDRLFYSTECLTDDSFYIDCLNQTSDISVNNGNLLLNGETSYSSTTKYGLYLGNYVINNIPSAHPLALLNNDISNLVTYSGSTLESTTNVDGVPYNFYSGSMYITVKGDFNSVDPSGLSLYCSNHGYMGAENIFKYSELCTTIGEGYYIEDLSNTITFNKVGDKILLNNESSYDEYKKYGLYVGTYTISNVPEEDALAITNKDFLSKIAYTGTQLKGKTTIDDVSYSFYYGNVSIYVFEPFDNIKNSYPPVSELSFYSYTNGYLGGLEKLVYYDIPRNYDTLSYTICLNEQSIIKIFNVDNSDNYTFNDSATYYDYKKYGMHIGKYILKDVPMSEPIALLNQDVSNVITYTGKSNKKVVANDPSGNSRDFYFGNVEIEVTGDFGNLSVYSANGKYLGGENILTFTDFCETNGYVIECLELESSMNIYNNNFTLNNASSYNQFKKYGLTTGSYRITNIPSSQALTFINHDLSDVVIVTGDSVDLCGNFTGPDGNNYNFYTNELNVTIKNEFTGFLPLYSYSDSSHNNGAELFVYSDLCTSINKSQTFIHCLNNETTNDISLAVNDSTKLLLDSGLVNHNSSLKYGVYTGNYIFDVPSTHPIAFLNVDVSNHVSYFGNEENKSLGSAPKGNENIEYEFYHGRVILNVFGDFGTLSYYIKDDNDPSGGSYMGGLNAIRYSDFCDDQQSTTGIACLTTNSSFNLLENSGSYVYTLNGDSSIVNNRNYGVHENIYTLSDICENYPIAILNNGIEEKISYGGADADLCGNFTAPDGNNYDFYKNQITISVSDSSFNNLSFYVYNPSNSGYFGLQNKLIYSDLCEDTLAETDEVVEDILTTSFDKQAA